MRDAVRVRDGVPVLPPAGLGRGQEEGEEKVKLPVKIPAEVFDVPAPGYMVQWEADGMVRMRFFTDQGFGLEARAFSHQLLLQGIRPRVHAVMRIFDIEPGMPVKRIKDRYIPIVDHILSKQIKGEGMQITERSKPDKTPKQILEEDRG